MCGLSEGLGGDEEVLGEVLHGLSFGASCEASIKLVGVVGSSRAQLMENFSKGQYTDWAETTMPKKFARS